MVSYLYLGGGTPAGELVLILIVMDNGLLPVEVAESEYFKGVLILIVMDNGLLLSLMAAIENLIPS